MNFTDQVNAPATTNVIFADEARKRLYAGIEIAAKAVGCTLGPKGKTVLIQQSGMGPVVTKDGVTVSRSIKLKDPIMRMGAELVREAAARTNDIAGDGTTTSTILTHSLIKEGLKLLGAGWDAKDVCTSFEKCAREIDVRLVASAKKLETKEEIAQVGTISANGDTEIGDLIAAAMEKVGKDGIITVEDAKGMTTSLGIAEGMMFDRGYLSPFFVTDNDKMHALYNDAFVLVTDKKISNLNDIVPILERVLKAQAPLLIIAEDIDGAALNGLVLNRVKANLPVVAIKAPGYGQHRDELLKDICTLTGANLISNSTGITLEQAQLSVLGKVKRVIVDAKTTTLVGTGENKVRIDAHVASLRSQLLDVTLSEEQIVKLRTRIAKLASGVAVIKVGGLTEVEMIERKYRIEDALNATRAAAEEGIVPGGGMALFNAVGKLQKELKDAELVIDVGTQAVFNACNEPLRRIATNAGVSADVVIERLKNEHAVGTDIGYNAATGEYVDLIAAGVIDPTKVTRVALKHATSVAITFLTLDAVIYEDENGSSSKEE